MQAPKKLLLFGATGAIGSAVGQRFSDSGSTVVGVGRRADATKGILRWDPLDADDAQGVAAVAAGGPFDAVVWAQGANCNDSAYDVDVERHIELYYANVLYIVQSLAILLKGGLLSKPARLCVISSIWQNIARQEKYSYCITKSALQGLVLSAAADLGRDGHLINAVMPGVIDTPMSRRNLRPEQLSAITAATQFGRLPAMEDVTNAVFSLCSESNTGLTGQFMQVDLGFSHVRVI
jgi:NAD(P)-dependent dehydrogenase (short-subunit alcohol dehydrogenase family)